MKKLASNNGNRQAKRYFMKFRIKIYEIKLAWPFMFYYPLNLKSLKNANISGITNLTINDQQINNFQLFCCKTTFESCREYQKVLFVRGLLSFISQVNISTRRR